MQAKVGDVMSRDVRTVCRTSTVREALQLLVAHGLDELYVTGADGNLVGVIPDYELLKHRLATSGDEDSSVEALMSRRFLVVSPATPLTVALRHLRESFHRRIAVVEDMKVVGQISRASILRMLAPPVTGSVWPAAPHRPPKSEHSFLSPLEKSPADAMF